jgi:hypothetical protein
MAGNPILVGRTTRVVPALVSVPRSLEPSERGLALGPRRDVDRCADAGSVQHAAINNATAIIVRQSFNSKPSRSLCINA